MLKKTAAIVLGATLGFATTTYAAPRLADSYRPSTAEVVKFKSTHLTNSSATPGSPVKFTFVFTNVGTAPISISNVQVYCACLKVTFSKTPINPGQNGSFIETYTSSNIGGYIQNSMAKFSDGKTPVNLEISGFVATRKK
jgi:hypothetical protein